VNLPPGWNYPITAASGTVQAAVKSNDLLPSRVELNRQRLEEQRRLLSAGQTRYTPLQATTAGVIWDGHHGIRAAAEQMVTVDVLVVDVPLSPIGKLILDLPVR